jgi:hypothetical protein
MSAQGLERFRAHAEPSNSKMRRNGCGIVTRASRRGYACAGNLAPAAARHGE